MKPTVTTLIAATALLCGTLTSSIAISSETTNPIHIVKKSTSASYIVLGGTVIPWKTVKLLAQMPGDVETIAGSEGDLFSKGTTLVTLDTAALMAKRKSAEAQLDSARAGLNNAHMQYRRELANPNSQSNSMMGGIPAVMGIMTDPVRNASGRGGNSGIDRYATLHQYQVGIETAQNQIRQAEAGIRELDENIHNAKSIAPFDGTILNKMVEVGDIIQPGMPMIIFADTSRMQIQVEVPNRMLDQLNVGQTIPAELDNSHKPIEVRVARIFPMAEQGAHTTTVKFDLPLGVSAHAGMYASVKLKESEQQGDMPSVPKTSIVWRGSLPAVFLVTEDNRLKMQLIRMGSPIGNDTFAIISGLKEGDRILTKADSSTRSGQMVQEIQSNEQ
jgi:multidrug efflux pump subunit AcrA (membrane-fusion protein)